MGFVKGFYRLLTYRGVGEEVYKFVFFVRISPILPM